MDTPWDETFFTVQLGPFEKMRSANFNLDAYYFPDAGVTLLVNTPGSRVVTWRKGRDAQ